MSSGKPNWQKLHELGKLPKGMRENIPLLKELDEAKKRIKTLEGEIAFLKDEEGYVKKGPGRPPKTKLTAYGLLIDAD